MSDKWQEYLKDCRRICKYGTKCYQKNTEHQQKFKHPPQQQLKNKTGNNNSSKARFSPYSRNKEAKNIDNTLVSEKSVECEANSSSVMTRKLTDCDSAPDNSNTFTKISINQHTQYYGSDPENNFFKECFLVEMPSDFFQFFKCLNSGENSIEKLLSTVNLQLIGPFDLLLGKLPIIDNKDLYLIHWRFFYDPPEFQSILKKKGTEYHIGYFRDSPSEEPVFVAANNSKKDCSIKPIAKNIFGAVYWYLQEEKKTSPFISIACQKLMEKIDAYAKELNYTLEKFNIKSRRSQTVCKAFHGAGIAVPYNKKTQLGYRSLAESDAKIMKLFHQLGEAKTQVERDKILSEIQPVITYASIAVDECDFGTGLEAGIALFCSGLKELEPSALSSLSAVYSLLKRDAFGKIIEVHLKHRRKGPDMSIFTE